MTPASAAEILFCPGSFRKNRTKRNATRQLRRAPRNRSRGAPKGMTIEIHADVKTTKRARRGGGAPDWA
jgi:hypothetical protein